MLNITGYKILERINEGRTSVVYRGIDESNQKYILKILKFENSNQEEISKLNLEYEIIKNIDSEGVIKTYGIKNSQGNIILILEDFNAVSIKNYLHENKTFDLKTFLEVSIKISNAVAELHKHNVIHKDIKPHNILFNQETNQIKIIDFGCSSFINSVSNNTLAENMIRGTIKYISPEQTGRMNQPIDFRTDFYSLGITFYEMLTGKVPFESKDPLELIHLHIAKKPVPPDEVNPEIPKAISDIIMKLLEKNSFERYKSAYGLKTDLEICLEKMNKTGEINNFIPGKYDLSDELNITEKIYGREKEITSILHSFEHVGRGNTEMVLVSGVSGIGKSSLISSVQGRIIKNKCYMISGKFEQLKKNTPYYSIIEAFKNLIRTLLTEKKEKINELAKIIISELGNNTRAIIDVIPELELITGSNFINRFADPVEFQNRFNQILQKFISIFATKEHPLIICLDDLQWADSASLNLIKSIIFETKINYLLLIGSYRDNEINQSSYLNKLLLELKSYDVSINNIHLMPLKNNDISHLLSDILNQKSEKINQLAKIVYEKTQGNPFFFNEFIKSLHQRKLIEFRQGIGWEWSIDEIGKMQITENVIGLMVEKINFLSDNTRQVLKFASCIGSNFSFDTLTIAYQKSKSDTFLDLSEAINHGIILIMEDSQKFLHDKVHEAVYSLIPEDEKKHLHYKIGILLLKNTPEDKMESVIFEIVNQLNFGLDFIKDKNNLYEIAWLNLVAGKKAKNSTAYNLALRHFEIAIKLLDDISWQENYEQTLSLYMECAETYYLLTDFIESEKMFNIILKYARTNLEKAKVYETKVILYVTMNKMKQAIDTGLEGLKLLNLNVSTNKTSIKLNTFEEYIRTKLLFRKIGISNLIYLPDMKNPEKLIMMNIMIGIMTATYMSDTDLMIYMILKMVNISLKYGNSPVSSFAYISYATFLGFSLNEYQKSYELGKVSLRINDKFNNTRLKCKVNFIFASLIYEWTKSDRNDIALLIENLKYGMDSGDLIYVGYSVFQLLMKMFIRGDNIDNIYKIARGHYTFILKTKDSNILDSFLLVVQMLQCLRGNTYSTTSLSDDNFNEEKFLYSIRKTANKSTQSHFYLIKIRLCYLYENYTDALHYAEEMENFIDGCYGNSMVPEYYFYYSLILTAIYAKVTKTLQKKYLKKIKKNQKKLKIWADNCPEIILHKFLIVEAELANISRQYSLASELYNESIDMASNHNFIQNQALANELSAQFYLGRGHELIAKEYVMEAYNCYIKWGAKAKSSDIEKKYQSFFIKENSDKSKGNIDKSDLSLSSDKDFQLDLTTVLKASQTLSGEIFLNSLMDKLMKIAIESAGAQRGYLILKNDDDLFIEAEGSVDMETRLLQSIKLEESNLVSQAIVNYVQRTKRDVVINDALNEGIFTSDPYIIENKPKSIICLPVIKQSNLTGILYLENNLTVGAFTANRIQVLKLLASQSAISLENAKLYDQMRLLNNELEQNKNSLEEMIEKRTKQLKKTQKKLVEAAHNSGMAEMATGVLHNIGNILNSVNISNQVITDTLENSKLDGLIKANNMLSENIDNLSDFMENDQKGKKLPQYYLSVGDMLKNEHLNLMNEAKSLSEKISLMKDVIATQQHYAKTEFLTEKVNAINIVEDALSMQLSSLIRHGVNIKKNYSEVPDISIQKSKMINILINLIKNAKEAMEDNPSGEKILTIDISKIQNRYVSIKIIDNGEGITKENINKIFNHGFTTKKTGHGFGLHTCANAMTEMEGRLSVKSEGSGKGATFNLIFPIK